MSNPNFEHSLLDSLNLNSNLRLRVSDFEVQDLCNFKILLRLGQRCMLIPQKPIDRFLKPGILTKRKVRR
jgi:hypothetical protein